jgi:hypothetical protein
LQIAPVVTLDGASLARIDETVARAEEIVRHSEQAADACRIDDSHTRRIDQAFAATDRDIESLRPARVGLALRIAAWRRRRRSRRTVAKLERALTRNDLGVADRSSAALLAIVTERIARLSSSTALPHEIVEAIELTQRIVADYARQSDVIGGHLERAQRELASWRDKSATATLSNRADLATAAEGRVAMWQRRVTESESALAACEAGRRRLDDALVELQALAERSAMRVSP